MSLRFSAAHSSRIKKSTRPPTLRRNSSSPFALLPRQKPGTGSRAKRKSIGSGGEAEDEVDLFGDRLDDRGLVKALATDLSLRDVAQAIRYVRTRMFAPVPERAGMNSARIAEVLNFRKGLPPVVTVTHVQALLNAPTTVEREIAELVKGGAVRKIVVTGRGGIGEGLVLVKDLEEMINNAALDEGTKSGFIEALRANPTALRVERSSLTADQMRELMHAGFLTSSTPTWTPSEGFSRPGDGARGTATSVQAVSRAASGSLAAVGGQGAVHAAGGSGGGAALPGLGSPTVSLPSTGPLLKIVAGAKSHLVSLLSRSKFREAPVNVLRERWDGGVAAEDEAAEARKNRREYAGVLPGRTRKWKQFYGLTFDWILEECVGSGLVEVFETGSVGRGVRAL